MDGTEPVTEINQLPKLTAEVFDREDCPADTKIAVVNMDGGASWGSFATATVTHLGGWRGEGNGCWTKIPGKWDASDWQKSLIERPAKLPEWRKVGEYGYDYASGYFKIIKIIDGGINLKVEWVKEGVQGIVFGCNINNKKQARLRPYNAEEMKALVGKVIEFDVFAQLVLMYDGKDNAILAGDGYWISESILLKDYTIDGQPCGVFEHMENGEWVE
jgi:hypothetical protein